MRIFFFEIPSPFFIPVISDLFIRYSSDSPVSDLTAIFLTCLLYPILPDHLIALLFHDNVTVFSNEKERLCILCFENERISISIENDDLTKSFLKYRNLFISYEFLFSQFIHISNAYFDDYFSTFKRNCGKNSNFLSNDVFVIFWQWIILSF